MSTAKKGFNRTNTETAAAVAAAAQDFGNDDKAARVKLRNGLNVFYLVPAVGNTTYPIRFCMIHYGPYHLCGREMAYDPIADKVKTDSMFSKCPRCNGAWTERSKHIEKGFDYRNGTPLQQAAHKKFKRDMSSERAVMQVVDMSPFFTIKDGDAEPDMKLVKAWFGSFLAVMSGSEAPEEMPKDLVEAATAGPSLLAVNVDLGKRVDSIYRRTLKDEQQDPCFMPGQFLLSIRRTKGDLVDGIQKYDYKVESVSEKALARTGWKQTLNEAEEGFMEILAERAQDMVTPDPAEDTLESAAFALKKLTDKELNDYLQERNHSYVAKIEGAKDSEADVSLDDTAQEVDDSDLPTKSGELTDARAAFARKRAEKNS